MAIGAQLNSPPPSHTSTEGGGGPDPIRTLEALPSDAPADLAAADSVHAVDSSTPRQAGSVSKLPRHIQQRHLQRGLEAVGATQAVIAETEAWLLKNRNRLPVLLALHEYGWLVNEALGELQFDKKVVPALVAALQDRSDVHPELRMFLDDTVQEFLEDPENRAEYDLSEEEVDALLVQLRGLTSLQRLALSRTVEAASDLRDKASMPVVDACRARGLRVN